MTAVAKIKKGTFQHIESELYAYHDTKKEIIRLKNEFLHSITPPDLNGGSRGSWPSDPTGRKATLMTSHRKIEQMEQIINAIETVIERLPEDKKKMITLKYWTYPQTLTWEGIAQKIPVSRRQAINWRDEIVFAIADRIGWS